MPRHRDSIKPTMMMFSKSTPTMSSSSSTTSITNSDNTNVITDESIDQLFVLLRQEEETCYQTRDYLTNGNNCQLTVSQDEYERQYPTQDTSNDGGQQRECGDSSLLKHWRKATCVWAFRVAKFFGLNREVVTIAMNHLDRYLATVLLSSKTATTITTTISKQDFQLWVLTSLYLAVKLNHGCCQYDDRLYLHNTSSTLEAICQLSDPDPYDPQALEQMELTMLQALKWQVHPPTPQSILRLLWNSKMARKLLTFLHECHQEESSSSSCSNNNNSLLQNSSAEWWHLQVYDQSCEILDKVLEEYDISLGFSTSELAIATLLHVLDDSSSCKNFGGVDSSNPGEQEGDTNMTPSDWLVTQWKLFLPTEFATKIHSPSVNACRQQLEEYLSLQQQEDSEDDDVNDNMQKKRRNSVASCDNSAASEDVDLEIMSPPPATKKARRIRLVPSPACIRDTTAILM